MVPDHHYPDQALHLTQSADHLEETLHPVVGEDDGREPGVRRVKGGVGSLVRGDLLVPLQHLEAGESHPSWGGEVAGVHLGPPLLQPRYLSLGSQVKISFRIEDKHWSYEVMMKCLNV